MIRVGLRFDTVGKNMKCTRHALVMSMMGITMSSSCEPFPRLLLEKAGARRQSDLFSF
jgi:hypothetical protein